MDIWLKCNRRAVLWGCLPPLVLLVVGLVILLASYRVVPGVLALIRVAGVLLVLSSLLLLFALLWSLRRPRVACETPDLLLDLRSGPYVRLPLEVVECFLWAQGPSRVGRGRLAQAPAANLVIRLAERATAWRQREVKPALGRWHDGYITIHGAWCEPLDAAKVQRLNEKLTAAKRAAAGPPGADTQGPQR